MSKLWRWWLRLWADSGVGEEELAIWTLALVGYLMMLIMGVCSLLLESAADPQPAGAHCAWFCLVR